MANSMQYLQSSRHRCKNEPRRTQNRAATYAAAAEPNPNRCRTQPNQRKPPESPQKAPRKPRKVEQGNNEAPTKKARKWPISKRLQIHHHHHPKAARQQGSRGAGEQQGSRGAAPQNFKMAIRVPTGAMLPPLPQRIDIKGMPPNPQAQKPKFRLYFGGFVPPWGV